MQPNTGTDFRRPISAHAYELDMNIIIRSEIESDILAITDVTRAAFENHPYSHGTEEFIIRALRDGNALTISLVADDGKRLVGHAAFSPVTISGGSPGCYGLGPISVLPEFQRQGIGKSLIFLRNRGST